MQQDSVVSKIGCIMGGRSRYSNKLQNICKLKFMSGIWIKKCLMSSKKVKLSWFSRILCFSSYRFAGRQFSSFYSFSNILINWSYWSIFVSFYFSKYPIKVEESESCSFQAEFRVSPNLKYYLFSQNSSNCCIFYECGPFPNRLNSTIQYRMENPLSLYPIYISILNLFL